MTAEFKKLSRAASYGVPAASTNADIALQKELVAKGYIEYAGYGQNSMTARYSITPIGRVRLEELKAAA
jgi:hypothetical protein